MNVAWHILLGLGALTGLTFIVAYAWKAQHHWHRTALGWHLMGMTGSLTVAFVLMLIDSFVAVPVWVWLLVVANITGLLIQRTYLLISTNKHPEEFLR